MLDIDQVRARQEQHLASALNAWNEAKRNLENAIALAEAREREYREVYADVRKKLDALDLVVSLARELHQEVPEGRLIEPANQAELRLLSAAKETKANETKEKETAVTPVKTQTTTGDLQRLDGLFRRSSRSLFPSKQQARTASLSILQ
jgi:hypothetical protein